MLAKKDLDTFDEAGVTVEQIVAAAANFLRSHPVALVKPPINALTDAEERLLIAGGALGVGQHDPVTSAMNVAALSGEYGQMIATALPQREVAQLLGVSTSRVRQRADARTLYSVDGPQGRVFPAFQFTETGALPGLECVLPVLSPDTHPVAVMRFFVTPNADLEAESLNEAVSPRDWLKTGHPADAVARLSQEL